MENSDMKDLQRSPPPEYSVAVDGVGSGGNMIIPTLDQVFFGLASKIKFDTPGKAISRLEKSEYSFFARDPSDVLLFKGTVYIHTGKITLQNVTGQEILEIRRNAPGKYTVHHFLNELCGVNISGGRTPTIEILHPWDRNDIRVSIVNPGDFAFSYGTSSPPIVTCHMEMTKGSSLFTGVNGQVTFSGIEHTSKVESCIFLSALIAFVIRPFKEIEGRGYDNESATTATGIDIEQEIEHEVAKVCLQITSWALGVAAFFLFFHLFKSIFF